MADSQKAVTDIREKNLTVAKQSTMQAITQAAKEAAKAAIMAVKEEENPVIIARSVQVMHRMGGPALKLPTFNLKTGDKYQEI